MDIIKCSKCQKDFPNSFKECPFCGYPVTSSERSNNNIQARIKKKPFTIFSKKLLGLLFIFILIIPVFLAMSSHFHKHKWMEATCTTPKTCVMCNETDGTALGHHWKSATCTSPKQCTICGYTNGKPLEHSWVNATYTHPFRCIHCNTSRGKSIADQYPKNQSRLDGDKFKFTTNDFWILFEAQLNGTNYSLQKDTSSHYTLINNGKKTGVGFNITEKSGSDQVESVLAYVDASDFKTESDIYLESVFYMLMTIDPSLTYGDALYLVNSVTKNSILLGGNNSISYEERNQITHSLVLDGKSYIYIAMPTV